MYRYIRNYLTQRTFQVRVGNELSGLHIFENGVPQGGVISTTLFIIAMNDILDIIKTPVKISVYADDLLIYCRGYRGHTVIKLLQDAINHLENWGKTTGFTFSTSKTKMMTFSKKH